MIYLVPRSPDTFQIATGPAWRVGRKWPGVAPQAREPPLEIASFRSLEGVNPIQGHSRSFKVIQGHSRSFKVKKITCRRQVGLGALRRPRDPFPVFWSRCFLLRRRAQRQATERISCCARRTSFVPPSGGDATARRPYHPHYLLKT